MRGSEFRVPRTSAQFVTALWRILREHLRLVISKHEQWSFEHVADWSSPVPAEPWRSEWEFSRYWGVGTAGVRSEQGRLEEAKIRVMIEKQHWAALGYKDHFEFVFHVWVRLQDGTILTGSYTVWNDDGEFLSCQDKLPRLPRRFSFDLRQPVNPGGPDPSGRRRLAS